MSGRGPSGDRLPWRFPSVAAGLKAAREMRAQVRALDRAARDDRGPADLLPEPPGGGTALLPGGFGLVDQRLTPRPMLAVQQRAEIVGLLERVAPLRPRRVVEIGTASGGTLYLWTRVAHPEAVLVSVDLHNPTHAVALRRRFCRPGQRLVAVEGSSRDPAVVSAVQAALGGKPVDVLFIDGDHSYEGVRADWDLYRPLVRPGGIVALHDVHEDRRDPSFAPEIPVCGEVPRFWAELRAREPETEELVADPAQHGFGIGVVRVAG